MFSIIGWLIYCILFYVIPFRDRIYTTSFNKNLCHRGDDILHIYYQVDYFSDTSKYVDFFAVIYDSRQSDYSFNITTENKKENITISYIEKLHLPNLNFKFIPLPIRLNSSGVWSLFIRTLDKRICFRTQINMN